MKSYVLHANDKDRPGVFANLTKFLAELSEGKSWRIQIRLFRKERSKPANRYLWGVVYGTWCRAEGHRPKALHAFMCADYFGEVDTCIGGIHRQYPVRTTTTDEYGCDDVLEGEPFWNFVEHVRRRASEADIYIEDPDPAWRQ